MKRWYKSKTMWFNIITGLMSLSALIMQYVDRLGLEDHQAAYLAIALTITVNVGNAVLRKITTTGIG